MGGVISPLLANIALDGMDRWLSRKTKQRTYTYKSGKQGGQTRTHIVERYGFIRYADDFVITAETREEIEAIKPQVVDWLTERGLQLSEDKTRIRHISEGFDFLGFNVRRYGTKCLTKPQTEKVHAKLREIKSWLDKHPNVKPDAVIDVLNPILYGWANYYKHGVSKEVFAYFDQRMIQMLMRWTKKRHPKKGIRWIISRYFTRVGGDNWIFYARTTDRRGKPTVHHLYKVAHTKIVRHVKVRDIASPDDPTMTDYWAARATKQGKTYLDDAPQRRQLAERQKWLCPVCREHLFNGERRNVHHIERVTDGGTDEQDNLQLIHDACHKQIHSGRAKKESVGA